MGTETKIACDESLPGELVVIVLFALFLVLVISQLLAGCGRYEGIWNSARV
jgi:hypothetical protein